MRNSAIVGAGLLAGVLAGWFAWSRWAPSTATTESTGPRVGTSNVEQATNASASVQLEQGVSATGGARSSAGPARQELRSSILQGTVRDDGGAPILEARISWSDLSFDSDLLGSGAKRSVEQSGSIPPLESSSDADGNFAFNDWLKSASARESAVWVSHERFFAKDTRLPAAAESARPQLLVQLQPAPEIRVRVIGEDGHPVPGAELDQAGIERPDSGTSTQSGSDGSIRSFRRRYRTDNDGEVRLHPLRATQALTASNGAQRSPPWIGVPGPLTELRLGPTFGAAGTVRRFDPSLVSSDLTVACLGVHNHDRTILASTIVDRDGNWNLCALPLHDVAAYCFRLEGPGIVASEVSVTAPKPGELVQVDFDATPGLDMAVRVVSESGAPIPGAIAEALWYETDHWTPHRVRSDVEGGARLCVPTGRPVFVRAGAKGWAKSQVGPFTLPDPAVGLVVVTLEPGGQIEGHCASQGQPVTDFEVAFWRDDVRTRMSTVVSNSADGSYSIEGVPLGQVTVVAYSDRHPSSIPQVVTVLPEVKARLDIEIPSAVAGSGQIIDAVTAEPVTEAIVQMTSSVGGAVISDRGKPIPVDSGGRFEFASLGPGMNIVTITAPDYAGRRASAFAGPGQAPDFGVIALFRKQRLEIRLTSPGPIDFSQFQVESHRSGELSRKSFGVDGLVVYDEVEPGDYPLVIYYPDGTQQVSGLKLPPGQPWRVSFPVEGSASLGIEVDQFPGEVQATRVRASFRSGQGFETQRYALLGADGRSMFKNASGKEVVVTVFDADWNPLRTVCSPLAPTGHSVVRVPASARDLHVKVVDDKGDPVQEAEVLLATVSNEAGWRDGRTTNELGECLVPGLALDAVRISAYHPTLGGTSSHVLDLRTPPPDPFVIELANLHPIQLRVADRGEPCAGVRVVLFDVVGGETGAIETVAGGLGTSSPLEPGSYRLRVQQPGYWRVDQSLEHTASSGVVGLEVRRLGSLECEVRNAQGLPVSGLPLRLTSVEFSVDIASWIDSGEWVGPPGGLVTDLHGKLHVTGLPNGPYRWQVLLPEGNPIEGSATVLPKDLATVLIVLP